MSIQDPNLAAQKVTILMGLHNGAAHLAAQLDSIAAQTHRNWTLICSDDGSTDKTRQIVREFAHQHTGQVHLKGGPEKGFAANFMHLISTLSPDAGYVSFADQDDVWEPDKIARALHLLQDEDGAPTLYTSQCWYWYPETERRQASVRPMRPAGFRNALIENIATGNTIVLNPAAAQLAQQAAQRTERVFAHDWWLYLLITGVGGQVVFDPGPPSLLYRQHAGNVIGGGQGAGAQVQRKIKVLQGAFSERMRSNITALQQVRDLLTQDNRAVLDAFEAARGAGLLRRLSGLRDIGPYRQTLIGNLGFWGAASLGRI